MQIDSKQLAPTVVLAQHGNKSAIKELYKLYHKSVYFICTCLCGNGEAAEQTSIRTFEALFDELPALRDVMHFDTHCRCVAIETALQAGRPARDAGRIGRELQKLAADAGEAAAAGDREAFSHANRRILCAVIEALPADQCAELFYRSGIGLSAEESALRQELPPNREAALYDALQASLADYRKRMTEYGCSIDAFFERPDETLQYLESKTFVPNAVHAALSKRLGFDINPLSPSPKEKEAMRESAVEKQAAPAPEKKPKQIFTRHDLILFFSVIAVVLLIIGVGTRLSQKRKDAAAQTLPPQTTAAPAEIWSGNAAKYFAYGDGTEASPYKISDGSQLALLAQKVNEGDARYAGAVYELTKDIALNDAVDAADWGSIPPANEWTPIGTPAATGDAAAFTGTFKGNGHTISGLYVNETRDGCGLFGMVKNATITDLTVRRGYVSAGRYSALMIGYAVYDAPQGVQTLSRLGASGTVVGSNDAAGGLIGCLRVENADAALVLTACAADAQVSATQGAAAGLVGVCECEAGNLSINNSFTNGRVLGEGACTGGIVGTARANEGTLQLIRSYNAASVVGSTAAAGGICGSAEVYAPAGGIIVRECVLLEDSAKAALGEAAGGTQNENVKTETLKTFSEKKMSAQKEFTDFDFAEIWQFGTAAHYKYPTLIGVQIP